MSTPTAGPEGSWWDRDASAGGGPAPGEPEVDRFGWPVEQRSSAHAPIQWKAARPSSVELRDSCQHLAERVRVFSNGTDGIAQRPDVARALREAYFALQNLEETIADAAGIEQRKIRFGRGGRPRIEVISPSCLWSTARAMPLTGFLSAVESERLTGTLRVGLERELLTIGLREGRVVSVWSDRPSPGERLGEILQSRESLRPDELWPVLERARREGRRLGASLLESGLVRAEQLSSALSAQAQALFFRLICAPEVPYTFSLEPLEPTDDRLDLSVTGLLLETARRMDERSDVA